MAGSNRISACPKRLLMLVRMPLSVSLHAARAEDVSRD